MAAAERSTAGRGVKCGPWESCECEDGRLSPEDLWRRDRRHGHGLGCDVGATLISVDLEEHVTDAQRHPIVMSRTTSGVLYHGARHRGPTTDVPLNRDRAWLVIRALVTDPRAGRQPGQLATV
jgi:hypothetical protein